MDILKDLTGITGAGFVTDDESVLSGYASDLSFSAGTKPEGRWLSGHDRRGEPYREMGQRK